MSKAAQRMSIIDVWKLIFSVLIMLHHGYLFEIPEPYPFLDSWIYVEFFLLVTGYFTAAHFARVDVPLEQRGAYAMKYTLKKYYPIFVVLLIAMLTSFALKVWNGEVRDFWSVLRCVEEMLFEMSFLTGSGIAKASVIPVWYVSAIFLLLPVIGWLLLSDRAGGGLYRKILCWLLPVLIYGQIGVGSHTSFSSILYSLLRTFACLSLGVFLYEICQWLAQKAFSKRERVLGTLCETGALLFTVFLAFHSRSYPRLTLVLFVAALTLLFSGISYSSGFYSKWVQRISLLSLIVYLVHWPVFLQIQRWLGESQMRFRLKLLAAIAISFAYSFLILIFYQKVFAKWLHRRTGQKKENDAERSQERIQRT